jgi:hypothetical protein
MPRFNAQAGFRPPPPPPPPGPCPCLWALGMAASASTGAGGPRTVGYQLSVRFHADLSGFLLSGRQNSNALNGQDIGFRIKWARSFESASTFKSPSTLRTLEMLETAKPLMKPSLRPPRCFRCHKNGQCAQASKMTHEALTTAPQYALSRLHTHQIPLREACLVSSFRPLSPQPGRQRAVRYRRTESRKI